MTRIFFMYMIPIILPSILFFCWAKFIQKDAVLARTGPWFRLLIAGLSLMALGLAITAITGGTTPGGKYNAPYLKDGKVIPGQILPKDKPQQ
jgi:uncharacterized membrane-anchored protein YitT (DUF2179 family)